MVCKTCVQLEEAVEASLRPDPPEILLGLAEAGKRNRALQKEERIVKARENLEKHRRTCPAWEERPAF